MKQFHILLCAFLILPMSVWADDAAWDIARDSDGIKVWTRHESGHSVHSFKAVTTVKSSLSALVALILDTDYAPEWVYRVDKVEVIKRDEARSTFVVRVLTNFPWPLADRDVVVMGQMLQDPKTLTVSIVSRTPATEHYPEYPDYVRMPDFDGLWQFKPLGNGMVEVTMVGRADPGGNIPSAAVNLLVHDTPYRTLKVMRKTVQDPRFQKAQLKQIREP